MDKDVIFIWCGRCGALIGFKTPKGGPVAGDLDNTDMHMRWHNKTEGHSHILAPHSHGSRHEGIHMDRGL